VKPGSRLHRQGTRGRLDPFEEFLAWRYISFQMGDSSGLFSRRVPPDINEKAKRNPGKSRTGTKAKLDSYHRPLNDFDRLIDDLASACVWLCNDGRICNIKDRLGSNKQVTEVSFRASGLAILPLSCDHANDCFLRL